MILLFIIVLVFTSLGTVINIIDDIKNGNKHIDEQLLKLSNEVNTGLPKMIDLEIRYDSTIALPNKTFQFNSTLINYSKDEVNTNATKEQLYQNILNNLKTNPGFKFFKDNKVIIIFLVNDKNGHET